jgi:ribosome-associated protein
MIPVVLSWRAPALAKKISRKAADDAGRKFAIELARLAADDHCEDVLVLDLRGRSPVTDYFIIATGASDRQRRTVAEDAIKLVKSTGQAVLGASGLDQTDWVLVDLFDVVLHVFDGQTRRFYDLEMLWGDAPRIRWQRRTQTRPSEQKADEQ